MWQHLANACVFLVNGGKSWSCNSWGWVEVCVCVCVCVWRDGRSIARCGDRVCVVSLSGMTRSRTPWARRPTVKPAVDQPQTTRARAKTWALPLTVEYRRPTSGKHMHTHTLTMQLDYRTPSYIPLQTPTLQLLDISSMYTHILSLSLTHTHTRTPKHTYTYYCAIMYLPKLL